MSEKMERFIRTYWPVIAMLCGGLIAWGTVTAQVAGVAEGNKTMADTNKTILMKIDQQSEALASIRANLAGIQATSIAAGQVMADLQERVRTIERRR